MRRLFPPGWSAQTEIDYFIVSRDLHAAVRRCVAQPHPAIAKHRLVVLELSGESRNQNITVPKFQRPMPLDIPDGCPEAPPCYRNCSQAARAIDSQEVFDAVLLGLGEKLPSNIKALL